MASTSSTNSSSFSKRLLGKVALVTGGASGIGESIVRSFVKHGAKVCVADIQDDVGRHLCEALLDDVGSTSFIHCDVTVEDDVKRAVDHAVAEFGTLDIMVNNAGRTDPPRARTDICGLDLSSFDGVFDVNVRGVFAGMKHAARVMIPAKKGVIVSICSVSGVVGGVGSHAYTGSKHAVVGLTRSVAAELGRHGVRVNCVSPYGVPTKMSLSPLIARHGGSGISDEDVIARHRRMHASNAVLQGVELAIEDVANAVVFLSSDEARYVSGENLMVDGGFTSVNNSFRLFG
ncbi:hypothetical protein ABFX02_02G113600 [Erythranthe guttata]